mmetsp:Transcript_870/g.2707  ORF Transcript_870/g.2707 Transcript_870/m.2707 type:complete len:246 (+) Transcript_870:1629-2366(+)
MPLVAREANGPVALSLDVVRVVLREHPSRLAAHLLAWAHHRHLVRVERDHAHRARARRTDRARRREAKRAVLGRAGEPIEPLAQLLDVGKVVQLVVPLEVHDSAALRRHDSAKARQHVVERALRLAELGAEAVDHVAKVGDEGERFRLIVPVRHRARQLHERAAVVALHRARKVGPVVRVGVLHVGDDAKADGARRAECGTWRTFCARAERARLRAQIYQRGARRREAHAVRSHRPRIAVADCTE